MSALQILVLIYLTGSAGFTFYVILKHIHSTWMFIKQLYTARYVTPTSIKTYFGIDYYIGYDDDFWLEVMFISTLVTIGVCIGTILVWPLSILFILNNSIKKARARVEEGL